MSKNVVFIYRGFSGLFCQCGNVEVLTASNLKYHRFVSWWDTSGGHGQSRVTCRTCNSDTHEPEVRLKSADLRGRLAMAYPNVGVDELLLQCSTEK